MEAVGIMKEKTEWKVEREVFAGRKGVLNEPKCGGCNWETSVFYRLKGTRKDFDLTEGCGPGLCGNCFADLIVDNKATVKGVKR